MIDALREPESMVVTLQSGERIHYLDWPGAAGADDAAGADGAAGADDAAGADGAAGETDAAAMPFVLIHGLTRTAWTWVPVARRLAVGHPVVAPDLRGHGASDAPIHGYDLESLALDMLTVVAGKGWGDAVGGPPVVVAGHGLGAMVAVEMARLQGGGIAAVALVDGGWEEVFEATRMLPDQLVEAMADPPEVMASMETYLADRRDFDPTSWDADQDTAARAQVEEKHAGHVGLVTKGSVIRRCVETMYAYRPAQALADVSCPVIVLVAGSATADDEDERERMLALDDAQRARAAAGLDPVRVRRFDRTGHDLMRYRPDELADELERLTR